MFKTLVAIAVFACLLLALPGQASGEVTIGDANGSGAIDIDDVVFLIDYVLSGGFAPQTVWRGDADCSCNVDIDDVVYLINHIFSGGPPPCDWTEWVYTCGRCIPGDVNEDGVVDQEDVEYWQWCEQHPGFCEDFPPCCADINGDSVIDISDMVFLVSYITGGGMEPMPSELCLY